MPKSKVKRVAEALSWLPLRDDCEPKTKQNNLEMTSMLMGTMGIKSAFFPQMAASVSSCAKVSNC